MKSSEADNKEVKENEEQAPDGSESEDGLIFPPKPKRRRGTYLPPRKVSIIFPSVKSEILCRLAQLTSSKPIDVLQLVPKASTHQLCAFDDLIDATFPAESAKAKKSRPDLSHIMDGQKSPRYC